MAACVCHTRRRILRVFLQSNTLRSKSKQSAAKKEVFTEGNSLIREDDLVGVIGLEVHAQINSKSKLFSGASTAYGASPNTQVAFFDAALPGTLPVLNKYCVEAAVKTALAFNCKVNGRSTFDRKHYFYADMPAGYQITQQRKPIATEGYLEYLIYVRGKHKTATSHTARIHQIQLEQDSGKSIHDEKNSRSLVDLNRAGVALMEIVTKPDFHTGEEAAAFVMEVQSTLRHINTCDGRMEHGSLRVDANISVHKPGSPLGVRTEVKNLNSIKSVQQAIDYEITRQKSLVASGCSVVNETMSFDPSARVTVPMRDKEVLQDYRFMAEPNLPPLILSEGNIDSPHIVNITAIKSQLPEARCDIRSRLSAIGLKLEHVATLMELDLVNLFDKILELSPDDCQSAPKLFSFLYQVVMMFCGERKVSTSEFLSSVTADDLKYLWMENLGRMMTVDSCKKLLHKHLESSVSIQSLIQSDEFRKITDDSTIKEICVGVLNNHQAVVVKYNSKKQQVHYNQLLEAVMSQSQHRIDIRDASRVLKLCLDSSK